MVSDDELKFLMVNLPMILFACYSIISYEKEKSHPLIKIPISLSAVNLEVFISVLIYLAPKGNFDLSVWMIYFVIYLVISSIIAAQELFKSNVTCILFIISNYGIVSSFSYNIIEYDLQFVNNTNLLIIGIFVLILSMLLQKFVYK